MNIVIDWPIIVNDAISSIIAGLVTGIAIISIGYFVWKKQFIHSKRMEMYIRIIRLVEKINTIIYKSENNLSNEIYDVDIVYQKNINSFIELDEIASEFGLYFRIDYTYFIDLFKEAIDSMIVDETEMKNTTISPERKQFLIQKYKNHEVSRSLDESTEIVYDMFDSSKMKFSKNIIKTKDKRMFFISRYFLIRKINKQVKQKGATS